VRRATLLLVSLLFCLAACNRDDGPASPGGVDAGLLPPVPVATPVARPLPAGPRRPLDAASLRCDRLLPPERARDILGFAPQYLERKNRRDGETAVVCSHRPQHPGEMFSFQVACGDSDPPAAFGQLRRIHGAAGGARPSAVGREGTLARTSLLLLHPSRSCLVQVVSPETAGAPERLEQLAARIIEAAP
jgi:hypothetical protein